MTEPRAAHIVSHTHWDREWYRTYHSFRADLVEVVQKVLDALERDQAFEHFVLDGQAIVLEDYLEVRPRDAERIRALTAKGALSIGPWYILPDEFLVGPEAHVRNLVYGSRVAGAFGPVQKVGYMPDSFGHIAQMPQLLRGAGLDSFVYTRGNGGEIDELGHEYLWCAPDGSEVLAINQCDGYCNAGGLGFEELWHAHTRRAVDPARAVEKVRGLFERMARLSHADAYLLNNGCDHFPPQQELGSILAALREAFPKTEFRHGSLAEYVAAVRDAGVATRRFTGELIGGRHHHLLSGVWSARMPLKQKNDLAQRMLAECLEPVAAYAHFLHGRPYPEGQIEYAWKLLLKNHPHDSICGCSTDEVHREMGPRFDGVVQTAEQLVANTLTEFAPTFARQADDDGETVLCVMNPLPEARSEVVERLVVLPEAPRYPVLKDDEGNEFRCTVAERKTVRRFWGVDYRTDILGGRQRERAAQYGKEILAEKGDAFLTIQFQADLPPVGHVNLRLAEGERTEPFGSVLAKGDKIENDRCRVQLHADGTFDLWDKATHQHFPWLNRLENREDVGDEYDYSPCMIPEVVHASPGEIHVLENTDLKGTLEARYTLRMPAGIEPDRKRRRRDAVTCRVCTRVMLVHGSAIVHVETFFENLATDHRLRTLFPTDIATETVVSDGHFLVNHRPVRKPDGDDWVQPPMPTWPQQEFTLLQDGKRGLAVFNRGLPEIEATREGTIYLTLLRAVGWLSRDDFPTRCHQNAGPTLPTPEAQCPGEQRFEYAVVAFGGDYVEADIKGLSRRYRAPVLSVQGVQDQSVAGGTGLVSRQTKRTSISAVKKHETRDTLVVRLFNLTPEPVDETLGFGRDVKAAWRTDLLEERTKELRPAGRWLPLRVGPHEIVTVEAEFAAS